MKEKRPPGGGAKTLGVFSIAMINLAIIYSIRGLPLLAEEGTAAGFYLLVSAVFFLIPVAFISAELATAWPPRGPGGIYVWVRQALGGRWGFVAIWMQWSENVIWFPTVLSFIGATIAYIFMPNLANNKIYMLTTILLIYWAGTFANFRGMKTSAWISTSGVIATMISTLLIIGLGIAWLVSGSPLQVDLSWHAMLPDLTNLNSLVFLAGVMVITSGIEVSAVHEGDVSDPGRVFPRAILLSAVISFCALLLGAMGIAFVVPAKEISLVAGVMEAFEKFFAAYHIKWLVPAVAVLIVVGSIGEVAAWILGPSKGLLVTARDGLLPPFFQRCNENRVPVAILWVQAFIVTGLVLVFLLMPTINSAYWILTALTAQIYLIMYILLFVAGIVLRYKEPDTPRPFRVPFGNAGMWFLGILGMIGAIFTLFIGFLPPSQINEGNLYFYEAFLIAGMLVMILLPTLIYALRKPHWKNETPVD
ncbi:MAG TPA: amino acid permease [Deltaproteobacteria bacterium]|nr:amino acid permease [Deltaproteobacteria bacterium]